MTYTENYNLKKPDYIDWADVGDLNDNADTIDAQLKANATAISTEATRAAAAEKANADNISAIQTSFNNLWTVVHTW